MLAFLLVFGSVVEALGDVYFVALIFEVVLELLDFVLDVLQGEHPMLENADFH
jgi:hypothetical protein